MYVYLTDVPISNMLLSAQSRCFCMCCNLSLDPKLLLCIVSKAYQAGCCAYMLIKHSFFVLSFKSPYWYLFIFPPTPVVNN